MIAKLRAVIGLLEKILLLFRLRIKADATIDVTAWIFAKGIVVTGKYSI